MLKRYYSDSLDSLVQPGKALIIYGPRQVGKTTLLKSWLQNYSGKIYLGHGEDVNLRNILESHDFSLILPFFRDYDLVVIDEAQYVREIGLGLKILVDQLPNLKIIATGSSSFALSQQVGEPLVGRANTIKLFPLTVSELSDQYGSAYNPSNLGNLLVYGEYPQVVTASDFAQKTKLLTDLRDSYLLKDILILDQVKNSLLLHDLLRLLAYQIGGQVSIAELASNLKISHATVSRYLDLLEKVFIIMRVGGYSRNLRKEITKTARYYFYDLGVRNAVINNFNPVNTRNDVGQLWENFVFLERHKFRAYHNLIANQFFWRTWEGQEIDLVEEYSGRLNGYEFKWNPTKKITPPTTWTKLYPQATSQVIHPQNYLDFVTKSR